MSPRNVHADEDIEIIIADMDRRAAKRREVDRSKSYVEWLQRHSPQQYVALKARERR